jgi:hypothetical protein
MCFRFCSLYALEQSLMSLKIFYNCPKIERNVFQNIGYPSGWIHDQDVLFHKNDFSTRPIDWSLHQSIGVVQNWKIYFLFCVDQLVSALCLMNRLTWKILFLTIFECSLVFSFHQSICESIDDIFISPF